jgi:hypothetical protein
VNKINIGLILLATIVMGASNIVLARDSSEEDGINYIERVDHKHHQLVINDKIYVVPINLVTYIFDSKTRTRTKVNRYALKKGQSVMFKKTIKNRQAYINEITIFRK